MKKTACFILLCIGLVLGFGSSAYAEEAEPSVPSLTMSGSGQAAPGDMVYFSISGQDFTDIVGLEFFLTYDPTVLEYNYSYQSDWAYNALCTDSESEESEHVRRVHFTLMDANGLNGSGMLTGVYFNLKDSVAVDKTTVYLTVGECYDSSLNGVSVTNTTKCNLTIQKRQQVVDNVYLYGEFNNYSARVGEEVTFGVRCYDSFQNAVSGNVVLTYDSTILEFVSASHATQFDSRNVIFSENNSEGRYQFTFAGDSALNLYYSNLLQLTFRVKSGAGNATTVNSQVDGVYNEDLLPIYTTCSSGTLYVEEKRQETANYAVKLEQVNNGPAGGALVKVILPGNSHIAAGDFVLHYSNFYMNLNADDVKVVGDDKCFIVTGEEVSNGQVTFSFVAPDGISEDLTILEIFFRNRLEYSNSDYISVSLREGSKAVDAEGKTLIYEESSMCCYLSEPPRPRVGFSLSILEDDFLGFNLEVKIPKGTPVYDMYVSGMRDGDIQYLKDTAYEDMGDGYDTYVFSRRMTPLDTEQYLDCSVYNNGEYLFNQYICMRDYLYSLYYSESGMQYRGLVEALANYCTYAKWFLTGDTMGMPANYFLDYDKAHPQKIPAGMLDSYDVKTYLQGSGLTYIGMSLVLDSNLCMRYYFVPDAGKSVKDFNFAMDGKPLQTGSKGGVLYVDIPTGRELSSVAKPIIINNRYSVSGSVYSYVKQAVQVPELEELARAIYWYKAALYGGR